MKKLLLVVLILFFVNDTRATHLMGGEITWECIKSGNKAGQYVFQLKAYRDCQGIALPEDSIFLATHNIASISSITLYNFSVTDLSPNCDTLNGSNSEFSCGPSNLGFSGNGNGSVEEHIFRSDTIRILGTPDANGWHFTWGSCCRNNAITNLNNPNAGFTLRAVMYPFTDSLGVTYPNNDNCYDSSPKFYEKPRTILEVNNGYDPVSLTNGFTYSHNAFDEEQDSIVYEWGIPIDDSYDYLNPTSSAITFLSPYSYTSPINGITLNSTTGRTSYPADLQGNYVTCTKVSAYKCGDLVTEIYREIQVVLIPPTCNLGDTTNGNFGADTLCNVRPFVQPPFYYPGAINPYQWDTLVHCGDTVSFNFNASDNDYYPNGTQQDLLFEVSGGQFYNYNDGIPCQNPPCATFEELSSGATPPFSTANGVGTGYFEWVTSCNHVINSCSGYSPSIYTFVVRVSDDFCPAPAIENTAQVISITVFPPCDLKGNLVVTQPNCGLNNGQVIFNPSGGVPPYNTYIFDMNGIPVNPNSLYAGAYQIRITDSTYCEKIDTVIISSPPNVMTNIMSSTSVSCFGGSNGTVSTSANGGVLPYSYLWSNGDTTSSLTGLSAGTYVVTITDSINCTLNDTIIITEPTSLLAVDSTSNVSCFGSNNASVTFSLSGGTPGYIISAFGQTLPIQNPTSVTVPSNIPIPAGTYPYSITDFQGCILLDTIIITQPPPLINSNSIGYITCSGFNNGSINTNPSGGVGPYTYLWNTGDTTQFLVNIPSGLYFVSILDSNNCLTVDTILMLQPNQLNDSSFVTNPSCYGYNDGSINLVASGGTTPYSYLWSTGDTSQNLHNVTAGLYIVSIIDSNSCILFDTISVEEPDELFTYFNLNYISCFGLNDGNIDGTTSGGTLPYSFSWNTAQITEDLINIPSDMYILSVTDTNNCFFTDTVVVFEPDELVASLSLNSGSLVSLGSGGTVPYTYEIYGPTGLFATTSNNMGVSFIINPVLAGTYTLVVTDANGCIDSSEVDILTSSITDVDYIIDIDIFPNPSRGIFNLSFNSVIKQDIEISIYSLIGEKVYEKFIKGYYGDFSTSFDLKFFGSSIYLFEIKSNQLLIKRKLIVQ